MERIDVAIVGGGIVGMALALKLKERKPDLSIVIFEKETDVGLHASGRNSGVLHTGFYYQPDSLKAKLTVAGNNAMREFCRTNGLVINACGKLVVATNAQELEQLYELERRGVANGSGVQIIDRAEAEKIEPNVKTYEKALWSPNTATVDPKEVNQTLKAQLEDEGVVFKLGTRVLGVQEQVLHTTAGSFLFGRLINAAGLYADKLAQQCGFGMNYTLIPFKGLYMKYSANPTGIKTNIYPVPNLANPFLGTHFTVTKNGLVKLGPTATPAFWRENYRGFARFRFEEFAEVAVWETKLLVSDSFNFRKLAIDEIKKYNKQHFLAQARRLVQRLEDDAVEGYTEPGIRAQLLDKRTQKLVQDFVVEGDKRSVHILNAVSPGFTCSFPFAEYVIENHVLNNGD